jgi:hypothetical protein
MSKDKEDLKAKTLKDLQEKDNLAATLKQLASNHTALFIKMLKGSGDLEAPTSITLDKERPLKFNMTALRNLSVKHNLQIVELQQIATGHGTFDHVISALYFALEQADNDLTEGVFNKIIDNFRDARLIVDVVSTGLLSMFPEDKTRKTESGEDEDEETETPEDKKKKKK